MNFSSRATRLIDNIDVALERDRLDNEAIDELLDILQGQGNGDVLDIRVFLYLVEHPVMSQVLAAGSVPENLLEVVSQTMHAVTPMLGDRIGAPFATQLMWLRRRFDTEQKKYEMVRTRLADKERGGRTKIFASYIDTSPAPLFADALKAQFPQFYLDAQKLRQSRHDILRSDDRLVELLSFQWEPDEEQAQELKQRLQAMVNDLDDVDRVISTTLNDTDPLGHLVAGALAAHQNNDELASVLLSLVVVGNPYASQLAVFSGHLDPMLTRQGLSKFLVDVLLDQTPEEEKLIDDQSLRPAIIAARTVLPKIGSPVDDVEHQIDDIAEATAQQVRRSWSFCRGYLS